MKKKIKVIAALLALLCKQKLYSVENMQPELRHLIMILDVDKTEDPGNDKVAMMNRLIPALVQKAAPIIISPSLWFNFIERRTSFANSRYKKELEDNTHATLRTINNDSSIENNFLCYATPFDSAEWIMKKIPNIAYILIPKAYLKKILKNTSKDFRDNIPMLDAETTLFNCYKNNNQNWKFNIKRTCIRSKN